MEDGNRTNLVVALLVGLMLIVGGLALTASVSAGPGASTTEGSTVDASETSDPCVEFDDDPLWVTVHPSCIENLP